MLQIFAIINGTSVMNSGNSENSSVLELRGFGMDAKDARMQSTISFFLRWRAAITWLVSSAGVSAALWFVFSFPHLSPASKTIFSKIQPCNSKSFIHLLKVYLYTHRRDFQECTAVCLTTGGFQQSHNINNFISTPAKRAQAMCADTLIH